MEITNEARFENSRCVLMNGIKPGFIKLDYHLDNFFNSNPETINNLSLIVSNTRSLDDSVNRNYMHLGEQINGRGSNLFISANCINDISTLLKTVSKHNKKGHQISNILFHDHGNRDYIIVGEKITTGQVKSGIFDFLLDYTDQSTSLTLYSCLVGSSFARAFEKYDSFKICAPNFIINSNNFFYTKDIYSVSGNHILINENEYTCMQPLEIPEQFNNEGCRYGAQLSTNRCRKHNKDTHKKLGIKKSEYFYKHGY